MEGGVSNLEISETERKVLDIAWSKLKNGTNDEIGIDEIADEMPGVGDKAVLKICKGLEVKGLFRFKGSRDIGYFKDMEKKYFELKKKDKK